MNKEKFNDYLKNRYEKEITWYDRSASWNHKAYQVSHWMTIFFAALTPILIVVGEGWVEWIAVASAILIAIATGALKAFKYQENWINYRTTCETLRKEIHFYKAQTQGYDNVENREALFVERVESLISRENTLWVITHEKEEHDKSK